MAPAAMGGGADTGSGFKGLVTKFCLTGTSSMMAEVRETGSRTGPQPAHARE